MHSAGPSTWRLFADVCGEAGKTSGDAVANTTMQLSAVRDSAPVVRLVHPRAPMTGTSQQTEHLRGDDSAAWLAALRGAPAQREEALAALHALLLRGARHELSRRRAHADAPRPRRPRRPRDAGRRRRAGRDPRQARHVPRREPLHDLGVQVRPARGGRQGPPPRLARPRGRARGRRLAGRSRRRPVGPADRSRAASCSARSATPSRTALTPHQREVFCALALNGVPIDVLAERLSTTRGALYKTLHDARRKLRAALADAGSPWTTPPHGRRT